MKSSSSLQRRLLWIILGSMTLLWITFGNLIQEEARHEAEEIFDAHLIQTSKLLLTLVEGELSEAKEHRWHLITPYQLDEIAQQFHHYEHRVAFQITDRNGELLLKSFHAPKELLSTKINQFQNRMIEQQHWRTFSLEHPQAIIHVGERIEMRNEIADEIIEHLSQYALFTFPLLALLVWWSVRHGLRPISTITTNLAKRDSQHLQKIRLEQTPKELVPLVEALNQLFSRLHSAIEKERRFTADAAHELRTPLAGIKTQAQVALNEENVEQRNHALRQIIEGVDRTTHLAEQLLSLARIDTINELEKETTQVDLHSIIEENLSIFRHRATQSDITLKWKEEPPKEVPVLVQGSSELLSILVRNLIDNAIRYSPAGGVVELSLSSSSQQALLTVRDHGPGIPSEKQRHIFERFYRNSHSASGSGLGLSIVQQIVELHHASIDLKNRNNPQGLQVTITFQDPRSSTS